MTQDKESTPTDVEPTAAEDVEGNSLLIGSTISADLARIRSREVERAAREHARAKEAKQSKARSIHPPIDPGADTLGDAVQGSGD